MKTSIKAAVVIGISVIVAIMLVLILRPAPKQYSSQAPPVATVLTLPPSVRTIVPITTVPVTTVPVTAMPMTALPTDEPAIMTTSAPMMDFM